MPFLVRVFAPGLRSAERLFTVFATWEQPCLGPGAWLFLSLKVSGLRFGPHGKWSPGQLGASCAVAPGRHERRLTPQALRLWKSLVPIYFCFL